MDPQLHEYLDGKRSAEELPAAAREEARTWDRVVEALRTAAPTGAPRGLVRGVMDRLGREAEDGEPHRGERPPCREPGGADAGVLDLPDLVQGLETLRTLAARQGAPLSVVALGPTRPAGDGGPDERSCLAVELCASHIRASDLRGWLDDGDLGIVAFDASGEGAETLARRLDSLAGSGEQPGLERDGDAPALSAGIVEVPPADPSGGETGGDAPESAPPALRLLAAAQRELHRAREEGGAVRRAPRNS